MLAIQKEIKSLFVLLFVMLCAASYAQEIEGTFLEHREGIYYEKTTGKAYTGPYTELYNDNKLASEGRFLNGKLEGPFQSYYKNGKVKARYTCKEGKFNGPAVGYFEKGNKRFEGNYERGKKNGEFIIYKEDGQEERRTTFEWGTPITQTEIKWKEF